MYGLFMSLEERITGNSVGRELRNKTFEASRRQKRGRCWEIILSPKDKIINYKI